MKKLVLRLSLLFTALFLVTISSASAQTTSDGGVKPIVIKAVAPNFQAIARAARALGKVVVNVTINPKGEVIATKLVSGHPLLNAAALAAATRWLFFATDKKEAERFVDLEFIYANAASKEEAGVFFMPPFQVEVIDYPPSIG